ncbi:hypothetical protein ACI77O_12805 [Pseudomonas tritici]|uniref:hypothetical protein n=1 Tax=Pseudomonas tritici TaxID=2745518 RepID=UPI00387A9AA8
MLDTDVSKYSFEVFTTQERRIINLPHFEQHVLQMKSEQGEVLSWSVEGTSLVIHYLSKVDNLMNFPESLLSDLVDGKAVLVVKSSQRAQDYLIKGY